MPDRSNPMEDSNERSKMEKAEGSRESVNLGSATDSPMERGGGQPSQPDKPLPSSSGTGGAPRQKRQGQTPEKDAGGITNRPLEEEEREQAELPPRGEKQ